MFEEDKSWDWDNKHEKIIMCDLEWDEHDDEEAQREEEAAQPVPVTDIREDNEPGSEETEEILPSSDPLSSDHQSSTSIQQRTRLPPV